jgi:hypothetical protein
MRMSALNAAARCGARDACAGATAGRVRRSPGSTGPLGRRSRRRETARAPLIRRRAYFTARLPPREQWRGLAHWSTVPVFDIETAVGRRQHGHAGLLLFAANAAFLAEENLLIF